MTPGGGGMAATAGGGGIGAADGGGGAPDGVGGAPGGGTFGACAMFDGGGAFGDAVGEAVPATTCCNVCCGAGAESRFQISVEPGGQGSDWIVTAPLAPEH